VVHRVRVKNRVDCCGERLRDTTVTIDGKICGNLPGSTKTGVWYEVKCEKPLMGKEIQLTTTRSAYLQISGVEVFGWSP
jgi:hypothetical protein